LGFDRQAVFGAVEQERLAIAALLDELDGPQLSSP
jgi:hypothetical protein